MTCALREAFSDSTNSAKRSSLNLEKWEENTKKPGDAPNTPTIKHNLKEKHRLKLKSVFKTQFPCRMSLVLQLSFEVVSGIFLGGKTNGAKKCKQVDESLMGALPIYHGGKQSNCCHSKHRPIDMFIFRSENQNLDLNKQISTS